MKRIICLLAGALIVASSLIEARTPSLLAEADQQAMSQWVENTIAGLSPEQRIAQLMIVGIDPRDNAPTRDLVSKMVSEYGVGGLIYNESSVAEQVSITNYAQSLASIPLMISIDAEWGLAMRLSDAPTFPRNLQLSSIDDDQVFYRYGREMARQCKLLGIHVNYAPVLDVLDRDGTIVGNRAFGFDADMVARHGIAYAKGLEDGGVLAVGKHFPGHGSTTADSHKTLPTIDKSLRELQLVDLLPFKKFINAGISGIMVAHLYVPALDKINRPGTTSNVIVSNLLQDELGFEGLIFTDALGMAGAKAAGGSACVQALIAGNDILLMPENIEKEIAAVMQAVAEGKISQADIDRHCRKMLAYKYALGINTKVSEINLAEAKQQLNSPEVNVLSRLMTEKSITVVQNSNNILPVRDLDKKNIAIVMLGATKLPKLVERCRSYADVKEVDAGDINATNNFDLVIIATADAASVEQAQQIASNAKNAVIAVLSPTQELNRFADVITSPKAKAALWSPNIDAIAQDYLAQVIFGGCNASGALPVNVKSTKNKKMFHAGQGVKYKATRLGYTIPAEVGFDARLQARIDSVCNYGVKEHAFPGCQVLVARHGKVVINSSYGEINFGSGIPITNETLFGLASVSKATGTIAAVMKTFDDNKFDLDEPASNYIPGLKVEGKSDLTFRQLLFHETGMKPSLNMWDMMMDKSTYTGQLITNKPTVSNTIKIMEGAYGNKDAKLRTDILSTERTEKFNIAIADGIYGGKITYDSVMARIYNSPLNSTRKYVYSCLNFSLLADAVQRINNRWLNDYVDNFVFAPLGSYHTLYRPLSKFPASQIAYTEIDTYLRRQHIHGYVHDELAAFSGGVQGNAGLFSNANDLAKLFQMWLNGGTYGGQRLLKTSTVDIFTKQKSPNSHRGLGFDKPVIGNPDASNTCPEATPSVYGHTGFTGTCYWVDPENDMIYIFLSNRVCPTRSNPNFTRVSARSHINSILYQSLKD